MANLGNAYKATREFLAEPFNRFLVLLLLVAAAYSFTFVSSPEPASPQQYGNLQGCNSTATVHFFYHPACPHCRQQMPENQKLAEEFPCAVFKYYDVSGEEGREALYSLAPHYREDSIHTPITMINGAEFLGFDPSSTPSLLRAALSKASTGAQPQGASKPQGSISLPLVGSISLSDYSLLSLSLLLGFIDGFNPCAMWVLVYLISITLTLHDRRKFVLIVGTFLFASGALYFAIMSAWLSAFLFVGYLRPVMIAVGALAAGWGILALREFAKSRGKIECKVGDIKEKRKLSGEVETLVNSPITLATFLGLVALAFTVNSIEFICSSAIPVVFTQTLSLASLSPLEYYGYILVYVLMYMLDDLVVFALAFTATGGFLGDRIASYGHAIGALILVVLGLALLFAPELLMA
jgi:thiol-disulfide isomerase/thioredoxin